MTEEELDPELDSNPKRLKLHSPEDDTNGISLKFCTDIYLWICNILSLFKNVTECCDSFEYLQLAEILDKNNDWEVGKASEDTGNGEQFGPNIVDCLPTQPISHTHCV